MFIHRFTEMLDPSEPTVHPNEQAFTQTYTLTSLTYALIDSICTYAHAHMNTPPTHMLRLSGPALGTSILRHTGTCVHIQYIRAYYSGYLWLHSKTTLNLVA